MSDPDAAGDPVFDRAPPAEPEAARRLSPLVRRIVADNPGPFTFTGTCSYVIGRGEVAIVDPGPADRRHIAALLAAIAGETLRHILVTHSHRDHSAAATALRRATGATLVGCAPRIERSRASPAGGETGAATPAAASLDAAFDPDWSPDWILREGEVVEGPNWRLDVLETPGHTSDHLCYALTGEDEAGGALLSGDHVMAWSTSVVAPPDGSMRAYLGSLHKLVGRRDRIYWPGHGGPVTAPQAFVRGLIRHRQQREAAILREIRQGERHVAPIVARLYVGLAPALHGAAALSVLAHLEHLVEQGLVAAEGPLSLRTGFHAL